MHNDCTPPIEEWEKGFVELFQILHELNQARTKKMWLDLFDENWRIKQQMEYNQWQENVKAYQEWKDTENEIRARAVQRKKVQQRIIFLDTLYREWSTLQQKRAWLQLFDEYRSIRQDREYYRWLHNKEAYETWCMTQEDARASQLLYDRVTERIHELHMAEDAYKLRSLQNQEQYLKECVSMGNASLVKLEADHKSIKERLIRLDGLRRRCDFDAKLYEEWRQEQFHVQVQLQQAQDRLGIFKEKKAQLGQLTQDLLTLEKKQSDLEFFGQTVFHRDGFPIFLLRRFLEQFENVLEEVTRPFMGNKKVRFDIESSSSSSSTAKNKIARSEKETSSVRMYIESNDGSMNPFLGGMEGLMVDMGLKIALTQMCTHIRSNIFVLDENVSVLDMEHLHSLRGVFEFLEEHFDFVLVISHLQVVKDFVQTSLHTSNINGFRSITFPSTDGS
jgi:hypothetical protein